jgi:hypothetical protein
MCSERSCNDIKCNINPLFCLFFFTKLTQVSLPYFAIICKTVLYFMWTEVLVYFSACAVECWIWPTLNFISLICIVVIIKVILPQISCDTCLYDNMIVSCNQYYVFYRPICSFLPVMFRIVISSYHIFRQRRIKLAILCSARSSRYVFFSKRGNYNPLVTSLCWLSSWSRVWGPL